MEPYRLTASEALSAFQDGSLTVEAYARSLLSRIAARDEAVKAWAYLDPEYVIAQAQALDAVPRAQRGPLHGVAVGVKDIIYTKDMPTQFNSPIYAGHAPAVDAASVMTLRQAGALIFGKTTTTEFASTRAGPATRNPHDASRTPGGSSAGSGAAVGDLQVPVALGTQTAGSVIRPAAFSGVWAFKPTWGAVSREGQRLYAPVLDTAGFYARGAADLRRLADVFALADDDDNNEEFALRGARFAFVRSPAWPQAGPGTAAAMARAARLLRGHGAVVEDVELPPAFDAVPAWHRRVMHGDGRAAFLAEYRVARDRLDPYLAGQVEDAAGGSRAALLEALDGMAALRPAIDRLAAGYAAIVTPSAVDEAPVGIESTGVAVFNAIWTGLHTPVVNIPGFQGENGMPVGLSLVAPRYHDRRLLAVAQEVGKIFESEGGWKRKN
ncbi:amidase [Xylariomycetidae sp. FL0641]|nr:amidase [Xylariomycetidae sp. FL0641]